MAAIDALSIVTLDAADAAAGLVLSTEARWNQTEADWRFFLEQGTVFGVRDGDRLVATAALLPYPAGNAWISMVLVTADYRRRGIATRLIDACLAAAKARGLVCWLDATPDGAAVYAPLGFAPGLQLRRLRLENDVTDRTAPPLSSSNLDEFIARDRRSMGFERSALLDAFARRPGSRLLSDGRAMALVRDGRTARHVGPLLAESPAAALALVDAIAASERAPLLLDAVHSHHGFLAGLTNSGWCIERPFQRMRFGDATIEPGELPFAVAGPEFG